MPDFAWWIVLVALGYLCGSVPFGYLIARAKGMDIREHGSGNIGATNVRRVLGSGPGNLCFALDVLKGALPVLIAGAIMRTLGDHALPAGTAWGWLGVAIAPVIGHMFPVWLRFKGGKGVATGLGALSALWPIVTPAAIVAFALWVLTVKVTRYVSVASCVAACSMPIAIVASRLAGWGLPSGADRLDHALGAWPFVVLTTLLAVLVVVKHRGNLTRVARGEEPKIGAKKTDT